MTSGCSGPIITRSIFSSTQNVSIISKLLVSREILVTLFSKAVPAFPGQTKTLDTDSS